MGYINKKDKNLLALLIKEKVYTLINSNKDNENDYLIIRYIELADNLKLDINFIIDNDTYYEIAKRYNLILTD